MNWLSITGYFRYHSRRAGSEFQVPGQIEEEGNRGCPRDGSEGAKLMSSLHLHLCAESAPATTVPFARIVYNSTIP